MMMTDLFKSFIHYNLAKLSDSLGSKSEKTKRKHSRLGTKTADQKLIPFVHSQLPLIIPLDFPRSEKQ